MSPSLGDVQLHAGLSSSDPSQGYAFGNVPFFSIIQLCVVLTCSVLLSILAECSEQTVCASFQCTMEPTEIQGKRPLAAGTLV